MTPSQIRLVQHSFEAVAPQRNRLAALFFAQLFVREPSLRAVFGTDMRVEGRELYFGLAGIVEALDRLYPIVPALEWLAGRGARRGIGERHYAAIVEALLAVLEMGLGEDFSPEVRDAWAAAARKVSGIMAAALEPEPLAA